MFDNKKDPMVDVVQKVMDENVRRRQIEADFNEELGIQDRKQLGHEKHDLYDQALLQRINEAVLSPKQKKIATVGDDTKDNEIDASDFAKLRGMKNEAKDVKNEEPPFKPDPPRKKRPDEPKTAKGLAKAAMRRYMKAAKDTKKTFPNVKHLTPAGNPDWQEHGYKDMPIKEEEQIDEERKRTSAVSSAFLAGKPAKQKELQTNGQEMTYHGNVIAKHAGDEVHVTTAGYGHSPSTRGHINGVLSRLGAPRLSQKRGKLMHGDTEVGTRDWIKIKKPTATMSEEQIDELSKKKLGDYIKKASHDVATKSAATGRFGEKSRKHSEDALASSAGSGDTSWIINVDNPGWKKTMAAIDTDKMANKFFRKSWKRREGIAKAVDKITNKEQIDELSKKLLGDYIKKAHVSGLGAAADAETAYQSGIKHTDNKLHIRAVLIKANKTGQKREDGINRAASKLSVNEEQIDELSKNLLGDYIVKASHDAADSAATGALLRGGPGTGASDMTRRKLRSHGIEAPHIRDLPRDNDANKLFKRSWKRGKGIETAVRRLKRGRPHNVTNEDVSLESVQEEIRNNLLERANSLLEHGSREQIVEFMNNLTMEQRSILNMQEASAEPKPIDPNMQENILASAVRGLGSLRSNFAKGVQTGKTGVTSGGASQTVTSTGQFGSSIRSPIGQTKVGEFPAQIAGRAGMAVGANPGKTAGAGVGVGAAVGAGVATRVGSPVTPAAAAPAPESDAYKASEIQRPFDKTPSAAPKAAAPKAAAPVTGAAAPVTGAAAPKAAAPVTGAPAPPPKPDYGSGNADAGFERGKYAKPDASDNSSGANELRSKQQAVDKHTENLGESKSKYMSESTMIRNLLRNR